MFSSPCRKYWFVTLKFLYASCLAGSSISGLAPRARRLCRYLFSNSSEASAPQPQHRPGRNKGEVQESATREKMAERDLPSPKGSHWDASKGKHLEGSGTTGAKTWNLSDLSFSKHRSPGRAPRRGHMRDSPDRTSETSVALLY